MEKAGYSFDSVADVAKWDHPDSTWNKAAMSTDQADPFCCRTEWQLSYHEAMQPDRELFVREVPGSLVAFCAYPPPLTSQDSSESFEFPHAYVPVESGWCFGSPLLGPDAVELLQDLVVELTPDSGDTSPTFVISGIRPGSKQLRDIVARMGSQCEFGQGESETLCNASLEGGVDGFLSRRSKKHRRNMGKQQRRAAREGVTFERHAPTDVATAAAVYDRIVAIENTSWKGIGECGMSTGRSLRYYDVMLRRLAMSGGARVMFALHEGRDIGFIFGGLAGSPEGVVYRGQQFSYANDWQSYSIGNLLQMEQIKWLCEDGVVRYDMGPLMDYKKHWTENQFSIAPLMLRLKSPGQRAQRELHL